jgi:metal-responsive CopG/Arc/MetJ family transcriptional regulator
MADRLKYRVRFSTSLDKKTVESLKDFSNKTMIPISKLVDVAVKEYIEKRE